MNCASKYTKFKGNTNPEDGKVTSVDTNVFEINLECLKLTSSLSTGDPYYCSNCRSVMNITSPLSQNSDAKLWTCLLCGQINEISIEEDEIPKENDQLYILERVTSTESCQDRPEKSHDSSAVIFCIDISGSMNLSKDVSGNVHLKPGKTVDKNGNIKVTRFECVQAAVESQLRFLQETNPFKKAGLVLFNSSVEIVGDGTNSEYIDRQILGNFGEMMNFAQNQTGKFLNCNIEESFVRITKKLLALKPSGGTALGPALLVSIFLAHEGGPGSKVVICTDGLANEGIGSLNGKVDEFDFYKEIGGISKELGVTVSVVTIEGQDCKLEALNFTTSQTEGDIVKIAPETLMSQFSNIISEEIIATEVQIKVILHKSIKFYNEKEEFLSSQGSVLSKFIGNSTLFTAFSFQYVLKSDEELSALGVAKSELNSLPLQAIIIYRGKDGNKYIKILNKVQNVVFDKEITNEEINADVMMRAGRREAARLIEEGRHTEAQHRAQEWAVVLKEEFKSEKVNEFVSDMRSVEEAVESRGYECRYTDTRIDEFQRMKRKK